MTQKTILVGYDGSEQSAKALEFAITMASKYGCGIHLAHVIDWSPYEYHTLEENEDQHKVRKEQLQKDRDALFPPLEEKIRKAGLNSTSETYFGHPSTVLADEADKRDAEAIVVGRRGMSIFKRALFGSVASTLVHETNRPVVIIP